MRDSVAALRAVQEERLRRLLAEVLATNGFYRAKLQGVASDRFRLDELETLPFTTKAELVADQAEHPPWGSNLTYSPERYVRLHKTSGTTGTPLRWPDTHASWEWFRSCWRKILELAGVGAGDRVFVAFSFGPFIGFWGAFEAAQDLGALALTGGALSSTERLEAIFENAATVLVATPTYALRLAEVAAQEGIALRDSPVRLGIHAGEPGASVPNVRRRLEEAWNMRCVDHAGATEVGAWGVSPGTDNEMLVLEEDFLPEVVDPDGDAPAPTDADGVRRGELVLTNLGRLGSPVIRYRTGDIVEMAPCGDTGPLYRRLRGGVLSRTDGMVVVRGINVYPSAIENLVRSIPPIGEFRATVVETRDLPRLRLEVEIAEADALALGGREAVVDQLRRTIHAGVALTPEIEVVPTGSLPRFELKARRFHIEKGDALLSSARFQELT